MAFRKALPPRQRLPCQGSCRAQARLRGWTKDSLTGKLLLNSTSPSSLTRCHLPYRGEALAFRKALPPRQRLPYQGQRRRPPPAAETGSRCWGRGQQDASDSAADAGCRNPALSNEVRLRGWTKDSLAGKLLLDSTSPSRLTPCHLPYRGEALAFRKALPPRQRLPCQGSCRAQARLRGWTKDSLTGKLLLNSTSPSSLTRCHLPYRGEALAFRKALPPRQRLPYQGQRRRPPPAAETGSRCWGRGQQDASDSAADAGCRNPALSNEVRLRGWTKDSLTGKLLLNSTSPSRLTPCHLPYRGEALAFRKALPLRQRLPY